MFGHNVTGGAINLITRKPKGEFGGEALFSYGNYNHVRAKISIDSPEWNGFSARATFYRDVKDGYVRNTRTGIPTTIPTFGTVYSAPTFGLNDEWAGVVALRYTGIEGLTVDYKFDFTEQRSSQNSPQGLFITADPLGLYPQQPANGGSTGISTSFIDAYGLDFLTPGKLKVRGHSLVAEYRVSDAVTLKSITGYRTLYSFSGGNDIDGGDLRLASGTRFCYICSIGVRDQQQFSQEFQIIGNTDRLSWIVGAFYFRETGSENSPVFLFRSFAGDRLPAPNLTAGDYGSGSLQDVRNKSLAAFAHFDYHLFDGLRAAAGIRFSKDDRWVRYFAAPGSFLIPQDATTTGRHTDYDASLTYAITNQINVYAKYATGYVSAGVLNFVPFEPETLTSYEIGSKSELFDRKLRFNIAAYRQFRKNAQATTFDATGTGDCGRPGTCIINNGEDIKSEGLELEVTAAPVRGLLLNGGFGYRKAITTGATRNTSLSNFNGSAQYTFPAFGNGTEFSLRGDAVYNRGGMARLRPGEEMGVLLKVGASPLER